MRTFRWVVLIVIIVAVLVAGYVLIENAHLDANLITALVTALAAAFAGWSAFLSSRAARETTQTARDALRALSWATKPVIGVDNTTKNVDPHYLVYIQNDSMNAIETASVRWRLRDGRTGERTFGKLAGRNSPKNVSVYVLGAWGVHYEPIDLGDYLATPGDDTFTIEYRGAYGPTTWRTTFTVTWVPERGPNGEVLYGTRTKRISDIELH